MKRDRNIVFGGRGQVQASGLTTSNNSMASNFTDFDYLFLDVYLPLLTDTKLFSPCIYWKSNIFIKDLQIK